jgi:hypothetical protein
LSVLAVRDTSGHRAYEAALHAPAGAPGVAAPSQREAFLRTSFTDRNLSSATQVGLVNNLNDGMAWGLLPLVYEAAGVSLQGIGWLAAIYPATWGAAQLVTGLASDRIGRKWLIVTGMWVQAAGIALVVGGGTFARFAVAAVLLGLGTAMVYPTLLAAIGDVADPAWRASSVGVYRLWRDGGYAIGAVLSGVTADLFGASAAVGVVAALTFASGLAAALRMQETLRRDDPVDATAHCRRFFEELGHAYDVRAVKTYRVDATTGFPAAPTLPCLDHEARLHGHTPVHAAAYVEDPRTGDLHEVVYTPARRRIVVDVASTQGEFGADSHARLMVFLRERFPGRHIGVAGPSALRGDRRVAEACRAQVRLRDVLRGTDLDALAASIERLRTVGAVMEKESRVASWGVRTATPPVLAAAGVLAWLALDALAAPLGRVWIEVLRSAILTLLGGSLLYFGLKAVHLTEMANRVWKRAAEYGLILAERRRAAARSVSVDPGREQGRS